MDKSQIEKLINDRVLTEKLNGDYRLKRPISILITQSVINKLKNVYNPGFEVGGLLEAKAIKPGYLEINQFHTIPNASSINYNYQPNAWEWDKKVNEILDRGNLPIALHTHPISLGFENYDNRRAWFYLKGSKADKQIARAGIYENLIMPEAIFTKDERLENGFGLIFYTGTIFPASVMALTTSQIVGGVAGLLATYFKKYRLAGVALAYLLFEFSRRPEYKYSDSGLLVNLSV